MSVYVQNHFPGMSQWQEAEPIQHHVKLNVVWRQHKECRMPCCKLCKELFCSYMEIAVNIHGHRRVLSQNRFDL